MAQRKYEVPALNLSKMYCETIAAALAEIKTGDDALRYFFKNADFGYKFDNLRNRVGVLKYKGIEVALLFKRQITAVAIGCDPATAGIVTEEDAWVKINLTNDKEITQQQSFAAKKALLDVVLLRQENLAQEQRIKTLEERIAVLEQENTAIIAKTMREVWGDLVLAYDAVLQMNGTLRTCMQRFFESAAKKSGIELLAPNTGEDFDPKRHTAVALEETTDKGKISKTISAGLRVAGKTIKTPSVAVGDKEICQTQEDTPQQ